MISDTILFHLLCIQLLSDAAKRSYSLPHCSTWIRSHVPRRSNLHLKFCVAPSEQHTPTHRAKSMSTAYIHIRTAPR
ncbi:hypothetical protein BJ508DRAFT_47814 [Ascobolus immersus RN42]|uniref:Secreted protein n=1 Tax=Ascobolus immersus RN42 TaxID=1160509 RepID=A0A3N4HVF4_ASCIM|nr:hypothetical protein BJ508DRAFT_47814 [Ascobolus immersus RN42]